MKDKKITIIFICFLIFSLIILFFYYKNSKNGKNIIKSKLDLKDYILNISSYEATISVEITTNKNTNKYLIKQWYAGPKLFKQEILAPENIKGLNLTYDGVNLTVENTRLKLSKIYKKYNCFTNNILCLGDFIENCKCTEIVVEEEEYKYKMKVETSNKYSKYKELIIDKKTNLPLELKIMDENKKTLVYILYNEITINNIAKEDII